MAAQQDNSVRGRKAFERGFTLLEVLAVVSISLILAAIGIPKYLSMMRYLRIAGDSRDINATMAMAKMRAAQDFTHARVHADLVGNTYELEFWDKNGNGGAGCWRTDGDRINRCTASASPQFPLSQGVNFGFGSVGAGNPNPQAIIAQAPLCSDAVAGGATGSTHSGTACIEFNSRGIPVAQNGLPTATDALYVTDGNFVYGTTVIVSGLIQTWSSSASTTAWQAR